ncbi:MAG: M18 family aminopeptidase [Deltaproteobacteria bacterium]|nr:M18 family aminopeptidase [Deltaproteobacteria bacterium]
MKKDQNFIQNFLTFLDQSPTPFHAVQNMRREFFKNGFGALNLNQVWKLKKNGKYFSTQNESSLFAFRLGKKSPDLSGFKIIGTHTDSPCLKLRSSPTKKSKNLLQAAVEVYGGVLLSTWFDRDLSLAGRISFENKSGEILSPLINFKEALAIIPSLAIHLDRSANESKSINAQKDLPPLLSSFLRNEEISIEDLILKQAQKEYPQEKIKKILGSELSFYPTQPAATIGSSSNFIASARLDNLLSCYAGMRALIDSNNNEENQALICNDHEEVGSGSFSGAEGPFLKESLERICGSREHYFQAIANSIFISCDNAHAWHPNFPEKYEDNHSPLLNAGLVLKINSNQRYATNSETSAYFTAACERAKVPTQKFMVRADINCGSTIGPITSTNLGIKTVDVGVPTLAMHSNRELAGSEDLVHLYEVLKNNSGNSKILKLA